METKEIKNYTLGVVAGYCVAPLLEGSWHSTKTFLAHPYLKAVITVILPAFEYTRCANTTKD